MWLLFGLEWGDLTTDDPHTPCLTISKIREPPGAWRARLGAGVL